jgi:hypothetical protein
LDDDKFFSILEIIYLGNPNVAIRKGVAHHFSIREHAIAQHTGAGANGSAAGR